MYYKYDMKKGTLYEWKIFVLPFVIAIVACLSFFSEMTTAKSLGLLDRQLVLGDVFLYFFKGEKIFEPENPEKFRFPFLWLINQLSIAFITGKYPLSELNNNYGISVLIKGKSRRKWIMSKYLWIISVCFLYYAMLILTIFVFSIIAGYELNINFLKSDSVYLLSPQYINAIEELKLYFLPLYVSITFSFLQLTISLYSNSIYGFLILLFLYGISVFSESIYAIGNCSLLIRNDIFNTSNIYTNNSYILLSVVMLSVCIIGIFFFDCHDIIPSRRDE